MGKPYPFGPFYCVAVSARQLSSRKHNLVNVSGCARWSKGLDKLNVYDRIHPIRNPHQFIMTGAYPPYSPFQLNLLTRPEHNSESVVCTEISGPIDFICEHLSKQAVLPGLGLFQSETKSTSLKG